MAGHSRKGFHHRICDFLKLRSPPAPVAGCSHRRPRAARSANRGSDPRPARWPGAAQRHRYHSVQRHVAILARHGRRAQPRWCPLAPLLEQVAILARCDGRVQQGTLSTPLTRCISCDPRPARWPGAARWFRSRSLRCIRSCDPRPHDSRAQLGSMTVLTASAGVLRSSPSAAAGRTLVVLASPPVGHQVADPRPARWPGASRARRSPGRTASRSCDPRPAR